MKFLSLMLLALLFSSSAFADNFYTPEYRVGVFKKIMIDYDQPTHIIIVGSAVKEDSNQFFQSGLAKAQRYLDISPASQVVIISSPEVRDTDDEEVFIRFNVPIMKTVQDALTPENLFTELFAFKKIASLDFYGHSSPWALKLGKKDAALDPSAYGKSLKKLKERLMPDAYVTLNSCNSGFEIAPEMSRQLEVPVSGALTSMVFERIESDGLWYKEDDFNQDNYVEINDKSYSGTLSCKDGFCWRMKPTLKYYSSYWGVFAEGGLSFPKFFCNFDHGEQSCLRGMAKAVMSFPSVRPVDLKSDLEDFKDVAMDWLCSTTKNRKAFFKCTEALNQAVTRGDMAYKISEGPELNCDFKSCHAKVVCKKKVLGKGPRGGSCKLETTPAENPTNAATEFVNLIKGFRSLKNI